MPDPITISARAAAATLSATYGPEIEVEVEQALHPRLARPSAAGGAKPYVDPVSVGGLIVAVATLAWTIYADLRKKEPEPPQESVTRAVQVELARQGNTISESTEEITRIVVTEIVTIAGRQPTDS